ncbi:hypothetical protein M8C21_019428 [Ambrosia artemisiifolia]|uniref:BAH domain-containing protein n=1 Tax=Ambrosia artemisiifolia TaxID=4212 RepID=A0AAD5CIL7_AMBAR|nr:hypothetical protein M8C21_019428 [Ambrosia artemisiifolia]
MGGGKFRDGRKINVGDCALFKPSYNSLPFVGRIRKLKLGKENNITLCVNWLYRPADVKLKDGAPLEAAPNEVFYSFHKDEIPAASLLHPCKVTFLRKGVEFPPGISSFVCRRVYDIESECLWWLTDKNYINELQEEVDQLLDKASIEMHGAVQTGGRSPKPINGPNGSAQLKHSSDNVQNSSSSISSHAKSKKREHGAHNSESVKRDRLSKVDDADSGQSRPEHILKAEIAKITDKGGLPKQSSGEAATKSPTSPVSTKLSPSSATKEGRSCSSSQSPNNSQSCSSDHGKTGASSVSKISSSVSHSKNSSNGFHVSTIPRVQNEVGKSEYLNRNFASEKGSPIKHISERASDASHVDNGSNPRLIVRLPNTNRSPVQTASVESPGDSSTVSGKGSLMAPSEKQDQKGDGKTDSLKNVQNTNTATDLSKCKEGLVVHDEEHGRKDASFGSGSSSGVTPKQGKLYEPSYSSINALVESCAKISEASLPPSASDVGGINLLASVAAGEMTRSDASPACSPASNSPILEESSSVNVAKSRQMANDGGHGEDDISVANGHAMVEQVGSVGGDNNTQLANMDHEDDKCLDEKPLKNTVGAPDASATSVKPETQINEESASWSSSDMHEDEKKLVHKRSTDQPVATTCDNLAPKSEENDDDNKAEQCARQNMDSGTSECANESMEKDGKIPVAAMQEVRSPEKPNDVTEPICGEDRTVKLDFDLNEVLPSDDGIQGEVEKAALHTPSALPSSNKNLSGLITVAAAAKGPFYPSENLSRGKPELGWKGSAATSAFRPAEPRKIDVPVSDNRTSKPARPLFDFDLNVGVEDAGLHNAPSGLDLDLNASEEGPEVVQLSVNRPRSFLPGGPNSSRDFDLNGPGVEEVGGESVSFSKNGMQFMSGVPNVRMNNMDMGNYSTWFPPNNAYPGITIPSQRMLAPVTASTSVNPEIFRGQVLSSSPAVAFPSNVPSNVPFQYSAFPFETNFSIPSMSNTFSSVSNAYVDSSSSGGGQLVFPTIPSVGPNGVVSMPYRPYFMSLPGGSSNVGPDGRKWGSQGLDLNAGPGGGSDDKLPFALRQLPLAGSQAVADEQLKMFQQMAAGGGGAPKRKEPDGGWDGNCRETEQRVGFREEYSPHDEAVFGWL